MISLDNLKTTLNAIKCLLTDYPKKRDIPTKLPNPNALNFTGAVTGSYDGSEALTVEIPSVENLATKSLVEIAQTTADSALTTATNAQTTADNAQTTANKNKEVLAGAFSSVATFTFDKQTSGRDTFKFNAFNYYKISDFNPSPSDVISFKGTKENGVESSKINAGSNCVEYGFFIVVASAGACSLPLTTTVDSFTAPSAGLYAKYEENNIYHTAGTGQFTLMSYGLTIKSSTYGSTKKFKITVDDAGTLSATEVTA